MLLAFTSKHPFVPRPSKDKNASRWIASLSDGSTVFEDITPGIPSAWHRLREYITTHSLALTNLRLEAFGHNILLMSYKAEDGTVQLNGYFYSKRQHILTGASLQAQWREVGIGFLRNNEIYITWISEKGDIRQEIRSHKEGNLAVIKTNG
jgi:hypothetical protein